MEYIIEKYYLLADSKLVKSIKHNNLVDCWFESTNNLQHRCLDIEDYDLIAK